MRIRRIIKNLKILRQTPVDQNWLRQSQNSLKSFIIKNPVRKPALSRPRLSEGIFKPLIFKPMPIAIIVLIISLATGGGVVTAAQNSLPTDALYPVKLAVENFQENLTFNTAKKIELQTKLADKRLRELEKLQAEKIEVSAEVMEKVLVKYRTHLDNTKNYLAQLNGETAAPKIVNTAIQLEKKMIEQQEKLEILANQVAPAVQPSVAQAKKAAIENEIKSLEKIEVKIEKIEATTGIKEMIPPTIKTEINEYVDNLEQKAENALNKVDNRRTEIRNRIDIFASQKDNRCSFEKKQNFLKELESKYQEMVKIYLEAKIKFNNKEFLEAIKKADEALIIAIDLDNFIGQWRSQCNITQPLILIDDGGILIVGFNQKFELKINETASLEKENIQITLTKIVNCGIVAQLCFDKATFRITHYPLKIGQPPLTLAVNQTGKIVNNIYLTLLAATENQVTLILSQKNTSIECKIPDCLSTTTGQTDSHGCPIYKCISQPPQSCPQFSPPAPDWCKGGEIIPGKIDENGCQSPPICRVKATEDEPTKTTAESESNFFSPILKSLENIFGKD